MHPLWSSTLLAALLHPIHGSLALHLNLPRRSASNVFAPRAPNGTASLDYDGPGYDVNITVGGQVFQATIDTGRWALLSFVPLICAPRIHSYKLSSDAWVAGTVQNAKDAGTTAEVQYAVGSADGPVRFADLTIAGITVPNQAFIQVVPSSDAPEGTGLIGLGPHVGSSIRDALNSSAGDPPLDRIFNQDLSVANYITLLLARPNNTAGDYTSEMTISEILPQYQDIANQPKIPVTIVPSQVSSQQHFSILLDSNGIIGPNGKSIQTNSNATAAPNYDPHRFQTVIDSGFTLPQLHKDVVDAIYSGLPGAQFVNVAGASGDLWTFDCDLEVNVSISIGNKLFPIHPLDLSRQGTDDNGNTFCYGTLQPTIPGAQSPLFDAIFGMAVLSNMYVMLNYGDFIDGMPSNTADPYIQFLSTTDPAKAHAEFVAQRLGGNDTTGSQPKSQNNDSGSGTNEGFFQKYKIPIFGAAAVVGAVALAGIVRLLIRRRKPAYRPLYDPAPVGDLPMPMPPVSGYNAGAYYADPWTQRR
ncbi:aspartic peptidase domain-containing protein [Russula dissimulans]|nr:aspartic peptidase domain-containing protein [Russula dissimulans]